MKKYLLSYSVLNEGLYECFIDLEEGKSLEKELKALLPLNNYITEADVYELVEDPEEDLTGDILQYVDRWSRQYKKDEEDRLSKRKAQKAAKKLEKDRAEYERLKNIFETNN